MTIAEFQQLQYGNVIADPQGNEFLVLHANKDAQGNTTHIGIIQALGDPVPTEYTIISKSRSETILSGRTVPPETGAK